MDQRARSFSISYGSIKHASNGSRCSIGFVAIEAPFDVWLYLNGLGFAGNMRVRDIGADFEIVTDANHRAGNVILKRSMSFPGIVSNEVEFRVELLCRNDVARRNIQDS